MNPAPAPAFYVGVTGHMNLAPESRPAVEAALARIFRWLTAPPGTDHGAPLGAGLGLEHTPVVLLSSLAPGADQWAAAVAAAAGMRVVAPLPFLPGQYERASTFQGSHLADEERAAGRVLLGEFLAKSPADAFLVRLPDEVDLGEDTLRARHEPLLTGPAHKPARDIRYGAAGEYVAAYSDLLIVLSDPVDRARDEAARATEAAAAHGQRRRLDVGTHGIADVKRRGLTPGRLPILPALTWADNGPALRVSAPGGAPPPPTAPRRGTSNSSSPTIPAPRSIPTPPTTTPPGRRRAAGSSASSPATWRSSTPTPPPATRRGRPANGSRCSSQATAGTRRSAWPSRKSRGNSRPRQSCAGSSGGSANCGGGWRTRTIFTTGG